VSARTPPPTLFWKTDKLIFEEKDICCRFSKKEIVFRKYLEFFENILNKSIREKRGLKSKLWVSKLNIFFHSLF